MVSTNRFLVYFVALAIMFSSAVEAQNFSPGPLLTVVDSTGSEVGQLMSEHSAIVIANDLAVCVEVERNRLYAEGGGWLYFSQPDCTGSAYFMANWPYNTAPLALGTTGPTGTLFVAEWEPGSQITAQSRYRSDDDECFNETQTYNFLIEAVPTVNLDTMFVPPFTVQPVSTTFQAGVPMPALNLQSAVVFILLLCCIAFFRLRSVN